MCSVNGKCTGWLVWLTVATCVLLTVGALALAWWQRSGGPDSGQRHLPTPQAGSGAAQCGKSACDVIDTADVGAETVELLSSPKGRAGKLRINGEGDPQLVDVSITHLGVSLRSGALQCSAGDSAACLVTGKYADGVVGEVFVVRGGTWDSPERPYFSNAGEITLEEVVDGESPNVVVVEHDCGPGTDPDACQVLPVVAKVYGLGGEVQGCTKDYPWPARIPGWPNIDLNGNELRSCE